MKEFSVSSNGDRWFLDEDLDSGQAFVLHRGNAASGGHETRTPVDLFLDQRPSGPEHEALLVVLDEKNKTMKTGVDVNGKTSSLKIAEEYLRLGGRRRAKVDDNIVSTRLWDDEPAEAEAFWKANVEPMNEDQRREVELHLPSMSDV